MNELIVTSDLDWACEPAIEEILNFFNEKKITPTIFSTHRSPCVETSMNTIDVGVHPYFYPDSSHGATIVEVVKHVMDLPHNFSAFRCHRFAICNSSRQAMLNAGMLISSNVCTDLESIAPFKERCGLLEIPIFLEDGGYLWQKHPLEITKEFMHFWLKSGPKVILIHPMHFALNTPNFEYMLNIKQTMNRKEWHNMTSQQLNALRWKGRGIRDFLIDLFDLPHSKSSLRSYTSRLLNVA